MKKILIIEDDKFIQKIFIDKLGDDKKVQLYTADTGIQGYEKAIEVNPDIILLDLILPDENGLEVLKKLRKNKSTKNAEIMIVTNVGFQDKIEEAKKLGSSDYFIKTNDHFLSIIDMLKTYL